MVGEGENLEVDATKVVATCSKWSLWNLNTYYATFLSSKQRNRDRVFLECTTPVGWSCILEGLYDTSWGFGVEEVRKTINVHELLSLIIMGDLLQDVLNGLVQYRGSYILLMYEVYVQSFRKLPHKDYFAHCSE